MIRIVCATIALTLAGLGVAHAGPPTEFLESHVRAVRDVLAVPVKAGTPEEAASNDKLKAIINPVMQFEDLSERALRKHWPTLNAVQKARFIALFRELVFHNYLKQVRSANEDYTIVYEDEEAKGRKAASVTAIAKTRKAEIELVFHLTTENGKVWVAIDEVSLVENYREQFNKIIAKDGFEALLKKMADKLVDLGGEVPAEAAAEATAPATPAPAMKKAP